MKSKYIFLSLLILLSISLSGCSDFTQKELSDRLIVTAIGIDRNQQEYEVSVQALNTDSVAQSDSGGSKETYTFSAKGKSVASAVAQIEANSGKLPLFSQARLLIIGYETAKMGLSGTFDYFTREYTARSDILFAVSEKTAKEIIEIENKGVPSADIIENQIRTGETNGLSCVAELYKFINLMLTESDCAVCPILKTEDKEKDKNSSDKEEQKSGEEESSEDGQKSSGDSEKTAQKQVTVSGSLLFVETKPVYTLSPEQTKLYLLLSEAAQHPNLTVKVDNESYSLRTVSSKTKIKTVTDSKKLTFNLELSLTCDINEYTQGVATGIRKNAVAAISKNTSESVCEKLTELIDSAFFKNKCDICRFGRYLMLKDREMYKEYFNEKGLINTDIICNISTEVAIRRIGKEVFLN